MHYPQVDSNNGLVIWLYICRRQDKIFVPLDHHKGIVSDSDNISLYDSKSFWYTEYGKKQSNPSGMEIFHYKDWRQCKFFMKFYFNRI